MPAKPRFSRLRFWTIATVVIVALLGLYMLGVTRFAHQLQSEMQDSFETAPALDKPVIDRAPPAP